MKPNYYEIFKHKLLEAEEKTDIQNESNLEKILKSSKKLTAVLVDLLTTQKHLNDEAKEQIRNVVSDIKCISYKPTTFRVVIPNGNYFDMKYDPTPLELRYPEDYKPQDSFTILVSGKKYNIANRSEYEQCLDYINVLLSTNPIAKAVSKEEPPAEEPPAEDQAPDETAPEAPPEGEDVPPEEEVPGKKKPKK
jgi:hypothetical protein